MTASEMKTKYDAAVADKLKAQTALSRKKAEYDREEKDAIKVLEENEVSIPEGAGQKQIREALQKLVKDLEASAEELQGEIEELMREAGV